MLGSIGRTAVASHESRNKRPSSSGVNLKRRRADCGGAVVAARSKFDAAIHDPEVEPMDEAAIATLLTKVPHARARLSAMAMTR